MEGGKVIRSAGVVGGFTLFSRGLGMVRDILIATQFGTSLWASAFFVAFTIPNLFRRLFGEGALASAFVPVLMETRTQEGEKAAWELTIKVFSISTALLTTISIIGVVFFSFGHQLPFLTEKWIITFDLSRIMFPYVLFICLAALVMAVLNSYRHFATSAFAPCLLNLLLIIAMVGIFPFINAELLRARVLAWAVLLAGITQFAVQLPVMKRFGGSFRLAGQWNDPRVRQIMILMGPAALGMAVTQFNVLIDRLLALWIGDWAPAALFYSERMIYFPLGIIATALATVLLPTFSAHAAEKNQLAMRETITHSIRHLVYIMIPATLGLLALAPLIIQTIFENGAFNTESTLLTTRALCCYAPGLVVFSAGKVFVPAFYAMKDTRTPVRIGIWSVALNLTLNIAFILTLPTYWKHAGMAGATVIAEGAGLIVLGTILTRRLGHLQWAGTLRNMLRCTLCALFMALYVWLAATVWQPFFAALLPTKIAQIFLLVAAAGAGAAIYLGLSILLRFPELDEIKAALRSKK